MSKLKMLVVAYHLSLVATSCGFYNNYSREQDRLWIDNIEKNQNAVYYIPTENKLPLLLSDKKSNNATVK